VKADPGFDEKTWSRLAEMGLLGLPFAEEDGGMGAGPIEVAIVAEEIGRVLAPEPFIETVVLAGGLVAAVGTAEQRGEILGAISEGATIAVFAHAEPGTRWVPTAEGVAATQGGDGWTLTGVKEPVPSGARADVLVVSAAVEGGTGLFLVQGDAAGLTRTGYRTHDGTRAANIRFESTPAVALGAGGDQTAAIERALAEARIAYGHEAIGAMDTALRTTAEYLKTRKQFGAGLGVDADDAAQQPLGRRHVDVAGTGDHVDRLAGARAVAEDGHGLGAADGVDLGDAQQGTGSEDTGVGQATVVALGRRGDGDRLHPGDLRGDDVHDDAGQQGREPAGHVQPDPPYRDPALGHRAAGNDLGGDVGPPLVGVHRADAGDRLLQRRAQRRVALGQRAVERGVRHGEVLGVDAVEPGGDLADGLRTADAHVLAQRSHRRHDGVDVRAGARQQPRQLAGPGQRGSAQVDAGEHGCLRCGRRGCNGGSSG
jgi:alkylation response protein AidB-like acyl-CoA dehydrogenase